MSLLLVLLLAAFAGPESPADVDLSGPSTPRTDVFRAGDAFVGAWAQYVGAEVEGLDAGHLTVARRDGALWLDIDGQPSRELTLVGPTKRLGFTLDGVSWEGRLDASLFELLLEGDDGSTASWRRTESSAWTEAAWANELSSKSRLAWAAGPWLGTWQDRSGGTAYTITLDHDLEGMTLEGPDGERRLEPGFGPGPRGEPTLRFVRRFDSETSSRHGHLGWSAVSGDLLLWSAEGSYWVKVDDDSDSEVPLEMLLRGTWEEFVDGERRSWSVFRRGPSLIGMPSLGGTEQPILVDRHDRLRRRTADGDVLGTHRGGHILWDNGTTWDIVAPGRDQASILVAYRMRIPMDFAAGPRENPGPNGTDDVVFRVKLAGQVKGFLVTVCDDDNGYGTYPYGTYQAGDPAPSWGSFNPNGRLRVVTSVPVMGDDEFVDVTDRLRDGPLTYRYGEHGQGEVAYLAFQPLGAHVGYGDRWCLMAEAPSGAVSVVPIPKR